MLKQAIAHAKARAAWWENRVSWWENRTARRICIAGVLVVVSCVPLLTVNAVKNRNAQLEAQKRPYLYAMPGPATWLQATQTTGAAYAFTPPDAQQMHVDPVFQAYYSAHAGASQLGTPLTAAFPVSQGWLQFFTAGALLLPSSNPASSSARTATSATSAAQLTQLIASGTRDKATGVVQLPLLQALLTAGSEMPIGGSDSTLTYAKLRSAAAVSALVHAPVAASATHQSAQADIFVPEGRQAGATIGHVIARPIWQYIIRADVSPDGWSTDYGNPLTEAIPFTATRDGTPHHLVAQAFWRGLVVMDTDAADAAGNPQITLADTGVAYLRTLGPPAVTISAKRPIWALSDVAVLNAPGTGSPIIHVGMNFPFTASEAKWVSGALWYHVRWTNPHTSGDGWSAATAMTFTSPGANAPVTASFDTLSPDLESYLDSVGSDNVATVVYDVTRNRYYTYNPDGAFIMASSAKVPIMLTFLTQTESQGREPNDDEMSLLTTMIENSNNDSAQALFDEEGGAPALASFMSQVGVSGLNPDPDAWGWSTITPRAMVQLLTLLHEGKVLTPNDRALALNLMQNIESDQQTGVGDTAPTGATVAMKDGWVPAPDDLWAMNTSGIVTVGNEVYIVSVYTQHQNSLDDGWAITQRVCSTVGQLLA